MKYLPIQCPVLAKYLYRIYGVINAIRRTLIHNVNRKTSRVLLPLRPGLIFCVWLQDDNVGLREEIEGLHRKYEALKRFAAQKKIRLPAEFEQYQ